MYVYMKEGREKDTERERDWKRGRKTAREKEKTPDRERERHKQRQIWKCTPVDGGWKETQAIQNSKT